MKRSKWIWRSGGGSFPAVLAVAGVMNSGVAEDLPPLSWGTFGETLARIVPQEEETLYEEIEWRSTLSVAVNEAAEQGKPVLVWAMNGDPCGFT